MKASTEIIGGAIAPPLVSATVPRSFQSGVLTQFWVTTGVYNMFNEIVITSYLFTSLG